MGQPEQPACPRCGPDRLSKYRSSISEFLVILIAIRLSRREVAVTLELVKTTGSRCTQTPAAHRAAQLRPIDLSSSFCNVERQCASWIVLPASHRPSAGVP